MPERQVETKDVTLAVLDNKLQHVLDRVDTAIEILERQDTRIRAMETDIAIIKAERLADRVKALEEQALPVVRSARWFAAVMVTLIVGLLWAIFTGQLQIARP